MKTRPFKYLVLSALLLAGGASALRAQNFSLGWTKIGGGGGAMSGGNFAANTTIGQQDASTQPSAGITYSLNDGFWAFLAPASQFSGAPCLWTNTAGGLWSTAANWSPNQVPGPTNAAYIIVPGTYTVTVDTAESVSNLILGAQSGTQTLSLNGGSLTMNSNSVVNSNGVLSLPSGHLFGQGPLTVNGTLALTSGTIGVTSVLINNLLSMSGNSGKTLQGTLVNAGTVNWSGGTLSIDSPSVFSNAPSGTVNITYSGIIAQQAGGTSSLFANAGQLNVNPGSGNTATMDIGFNNSGTVSNQSGTLALNDGGASTGSFGIAAGSTLNPNGGTYNFLAGSSVAGAGNFTVSVGTVNETGAFNVTGTSTVSSGAANFSGSYTIPGALNLNAGTLGASNGIFNVNGPMTWSAGTIQGNNNINPLGGLTMSSGGTKILEGPCTLINTATANWSGGSFQLDSPSVLSNAFGGTFNVTFGGIIEQSGSALFANAGQLNVNPGSGNTTTMDVVFNNSGSVSNESGTLTLNNGGTSTGSFSVAAGSTLNVNGGTYNLLSNSSVAGAGDFTVVNGTVNETGAFNMAGTSTFSGGAVNFSGSYTIPGVLNLTGSTFGASNGVFNVTGPMTWTAGPIQGTDNINPLGGLTLSGNGTKILEGSCTLINTATANWSGGVIQLDSPSVLSNAYGGTFNITVGGAIDQGGNALFANAGQLNVNPGSGNTVTIFPTLNNSGTVSNLSGTLSLNNGGVSTGSFGVAANATLNLNGGVYNFPTGSTVAGAGNFTVSGAGTANVNGTFNVAGTNTFSGGTANFSGNYTLSGNTVNVSGGTANYLPGGTVAPGILNLTSGTLTASNGAFNVSGPTTWTGSAIQGNGSINPQGGLTISGTVTKILEGTCTLINTATANWSGGVVQLNSPAVLSNASGGIFNITFGGTIDKSGSALFANAGQLNVNPGGGNTATMFPTLINSGTVSINSGTLNITTIFTQTGGLTLLNGGNVLNAANPLEIQGGTLAGNGFVSGSVTNNGNVSPGNPLGQMNIGGNYVQTANGTLDVALGGINAGTGFSLLTVSNNTAFLAGTLNVTFTNGFAPASNAVFTYLTAHTRSNVFANFFYPSSIETMTNIYASNAASLKSLTAPVQAVPPSLSITFVQPNSVAVSWTNTGSYTLQTNSNLSTTNWFSYSGTVTTSNGTNSVTITPPLGDLYFRLKP